MSRPKDTLRKSDLLRSITIYLIAILLLPAAGMDVVLAGRTLINGWIPFGVALLISAAAANVLHRNFKRLTRSDNRWINALCGTVIATPLLLLAFYSSNLLGASRQDVHTEEVTVERRYYKERHRTRRVGRRYVADGETYKVYYATVKFPDGFRKEIELTHSRYRDLHAGRQLTVEIATGLWGIRVLKSPI